MNKHSIGKTIATLRKSKGWTQAELAEKLNVSDKTVSKWENEAGLPEISQLPIMASLFDVSIDYLMTGKLQKEKVVTMSNAELCAKTDDVSLAKAVVNLPPDEKGKNIIGYILKYKSLKVFTELCKSNPNFIVRFELMDAITLSVLSNSLYLLSGKVFKVGNNCRFTFENEHEIKSLLPIEDAEFFANTETKYSCLIPRSFFAMIAKGKKINEETLDILLSNQNGRKCVWYHAFPYLIDEAYKNGNDKFLHRLLEISRKNNAIAYETIEPKNNSYRDECNYISNYFYIAHQYNPNRGHGLVRILKSTIQAALKKNDFQMLDELNLINIQVQQFAKTRCSSYESFTKSQCYIASADEIRVAKLKLDKSISETELQIQAAIHNGIISIKELKKITDFAAFKKALYDYPIHPFELVYGCYQKKNWQELFKYAVDYKENTWNGCLADAILSQDKEGIERGIAGWIDEKPACYRIKELQINNPEISSATRKPIPKSIYPDGRQTDLQEIADYLSEARKCIVEELENKFDKEKIVGELTKDYFYSELSNGNKEIVIVKLCVRMEAVLKCDYRYEGTFSEMLDCFFRQFNESDDEGNGYDPFTPAMLRDLRRNRNSILHSEKITEPMSDDEIKDCIDYICSL